jgi:hypothetical protein
VGERCQPGLLEVEEALGQPDTEEEADYRGDGVADASERNPDSADSDNEDSHHQASDRL